MMFTIYVFIYGITALITFSTTWVIWKKRHSPTGIGLFLFSAATTVYALGAAIEALIVSAGWKIILAKIQYIGTSGMAFCLILFVITYIGKDAWLTRRNLVLAGLLPVLNSLAALTNDFHGFLWKGFSEGLPGTNIMVYHHGPWFSVYASTLILYALSSLALLLNAMANNSAVYRLQTGAIVLAITAPFFAGMAYMAGYLPVPGLDILPIGLAVSGVALTYAVSSRGLLDLLPIAQNLLLEGMRDGIIVLDRYLRLIDDNPAFRSMFKVPREGRLIGLSADTFLPGSMLGLLSGCEAASVVLDLPGVDGGERNIEVSISPIISRRNIHLGWLLLCRDMTERVAAEEKLRAVNNELFMKLAEIEQLKNRLEDWVVRDPLTGLHNRRYLEEASEREVLNATRRNYPFSVLIIDVDHFKKINDTCGHEFGDIVLRSVGTYLTTSLRRTDIICRYGGDEFIVIMPGSRSASGLKVAEELRDLFPEHVNRSECSAGEPPEITLSIGVAAFPENGIEWKTVFRRADIALYLAKSRGRNRIELSHETDRVAAGELPDL